MKYCCFRFDADTHTCVSVGIPRLIELGDQRGVQFTFFVNMGRAFDPGITLAKAFRRLFAGRSSKSISAASKLGWQAALRVAVFNPRAGLSDPAALRDAHCSGHEIGLHGGRNHARWERSAHRWPDHRLRHEIEIGLAWMKQCGLPAPASFASPAWNSPPALRQVLSDTGFRFLADVYDPSQEGVYPLGQLVSIPTNIGFETGTAGYLETMRLRGCTTRQVVMDFQRQLRTKSSLAVVYDHPFFAGIHALEQVRALVDVARGEGFSVTTVRDAACALSTENQFVQTPQTLEN